MRFCKLIILFNLYFLLGLQSDRVFAQSTTVSKKSEQPSFEDLVDFSINGDIEKSGFPDDLMAFALALDSLEFEKLIVETKEKIRPKNYNNLISFYNLIATEKAIENGASRLNEVLKILNEMVQIAHESQDELLIGKCYLYFGNSMIEMQRYDYASTYLLTGIRIIEKIRPELLKSYDYLLLGGTLFDTRIYEEAIVYSKKGLEKPIPKNSARANFYNTIGQAFERLNQLDSAKYYYARCDEFCDLHDERVWKYINKQNIGELEFKENKISQAKQTFTSVYENCKEDVKEIAAKSLIWLAKISLLENQVETGINYLNEAEYLLKNFENRRLQTEYFLEDAYLTKLDVYKNLKNLDSSFYYFEKYNSLHDSLEYLASLADRSVVQSRIDNTEKTYSLGLLQIQKKEAEQRRNVIIFCLIFFSGVGFTYFSWQRKRLMYQNKITVLEKNAKETEVRIVKNQLKSFTKQLLEKAKLLEALESELDDKYQSDLRQEYLEQLNHSRILTDEDWSEFKSMFEKVYPGFFSRVKENFPTITPAEQRIASLIRLQFSAKEMADILGVSVDSVHKTRQRLRQRMELSSEVNLEEFLLDF